MSSFPSQTASPTPREMANALRALAMDAVQQANSGHPGMPMGMADVATTLFSRFLKYDGAHPDWPDRDRVVLSAGHGAMLLYGLLHLTGAPDLSLDDLRAFRQLGARAAGHPEHDALKGVEMTTGPLGQGLASAVGMALAERMLAARFGADLVDHRTFVLAGDGCLMEGVSQEAITLAGHWRLNRLIVLYDDNQITIDGPTSLADSGDALARFQACGWAAERVDGHDPDAIAAALARAIASDRPTLIACRTVIGFGAPTLAGTAGCHGAPLGAAEVAAARVALAWPEPPFEIPAPIRAAWRAAGERGRVARLQWETRLAAQDAATRTAWTRALSGALAPGWDAGLERLKQAAATAALAGATRQASQDALAAVAEAIPELVGGSADLTGSNNTRVAALAPLTAPDYHGRYIYYGVREHGMAAIMTGLALHGGFIPYGGTFLVFSDYCRPAIRLAALMRLRVIYVMTHDSIGLGEDGPTHQPVEHLAALRVIPGLRVFRPCDAVETAECWALALTTMHAPSLLALSRQALPAARRADDLAENRSAYGAYVLRPAATRRRATVIATGSEVALALAAQTQLNAAGIDVAVVSAPCLELFADQDAAYRRVTLGTQPRIVVEAALRQGWEDILGPNGIFIGMTGFGASAPAPALYRHFGITVDAIVAAVRTAIAGAGEKEERA